MDIGQTFASWTPLVLLGVFLFVVVRFVVRLIQRIPK